MGPSQEPQDFNKPADLPDSPEPQQTSDSAQPNFTQSQPEPTPSFPPTPEPAAFTQPTPSTTPAEAQPFGQQTTPSAFPTPAAAPVNQAPAVQGEDPGHTLGIISIVLSFFGLSLIGIILGVVSRKKSKAVGAAGTLGTIGMILGIVFTVIGVIAIGVLVAITMTAYSGIQDRQQNSSLAASANRLETKAEYYNAMSNDYPKTLEDFKKYPESTLSEDLDVNSAIYTNTAVTYVYCGTGAAQIVYLGETADDKVIKGLGTASSTQECPRTF